MSTSLSSVFAFATQQIYIYLGIPILIAGLLGGIANIVVFLSLKTFRQISCAFFLTVMSFVNIGQLLTSLLTRIMITGFNINLTDTSASFCKFRNYCLQVCALISYTCMCLATIDQFLATSLRPRWQQYMNIRKSYFLCILFIVIWLLYGIPTLIWYNLSLSSVTGKSTCSITNHIFQKYFTYSYLLILTGILPIFVTILFGSLAYWNVRQIPYRVIPLVRRELDKQLTSMVLIQVVFNCFFIVPYITVLFLVNTLDLTSKAINVSDLNFASAVAGMIYYLYFASPCYIYVCTSKRFRQQLFYVLSGFYYKWWKHQTIGINQVSPEGEDL